MKVVYPKVPNTSSQIIPEYLPKHDVDFWGNLTKVIAFSGRFLSQCPHGPIYVIP